MQQNRIGLITPILFITVKVEPNKTSIKAADKYPDEDFLATRGIYRIIVMPHTSHRHLTNSIKFDTLHPTNLSSFHS
jgi:hypothetical protein